MLPAAASGSSPSGGPGTTSSCAITIDRMLPALYALLAGEHLYFEIIGVLVTFLLLGKYLEYRSRNRASRAISSLMEMGAKHARVIRSGIEDTIPVDDVVPGDLMKVRPGDRGHRDGVLLGKCRDERVAIASFHSGMI